MYTILIHPWCIQTLSYIYLCTQVAINTPVTEIPIPAVTGLLCAILIAYLLNRFKTFWRVRRFFVFCSILFFLMAAGLLARSIGYIEDYIWEKAIANVPNSDTAIGYMVTTALWHVSWGDSKRVTSADGGWYVVNIQRNHHNVVITPNI